MVGCLARVNWWALTFAVWTALYAGILVVVTVPDYPRTIPLWQSLTTDPNGYWHEAFYITVGWLSGCALMALALVYATVRDILEALLNIFGRGP